MEAHTPGLVLHGDAGSAQPALPVAQELTPEPIHRHTIVSNEVSSKGVTLYVGRLPEAVEDDFLRSLLEQCGTVLSWKRPSRKFGFCTFAGPKDALCCLRLLGEVSIDGQAILVKPDDEGACKIDSFVKALENPLSVSSAMDLEAALLSKESITEQDESKRFVIEKLLSFRARKTGISMPLPKPETLAVQETIPNVPKSTLISVPFSKSVKRKPLKRKKSTTAFENLSRSSSTISTVEQLWEIIPDWDNCKDKLLPWLNKNILGYFNEPDEDLSKYILSLLPTEPKSLIKELLPLFSTDSEAFVISLWIHLSQL